MANMMDLPLEVLSSIITLLAMSRDGARDCARASATCKAIMTVARQSNVLRVVNCQNVMVVGRWEPHHHINGLLSRCVRAGNLSAECLLAQAVLGGGSRLWKMMLENDLMNSSIKCATALPLSERRYIAESLNTGSIADLPYILFLLEDLPEMHDSYRRLHHLRLVKSFVMLADIRDFMPVCHDLNDFMDFFAACLKYSESGTRADLRWMCWYERTTNANRPLTSAILEAFWARGIQVRPPSYRDEILSAFDDVD